MKKYTNIEEEAIAYYWDRFPRMGNWKCRPGNLDRFGDGQDFIVEEETVTYAVYQGKMIEADVSEDCLWSSWTEEDNHSDIPWDDVEINSVDVKFYHSGTSDDFWVHRTIQYCGKYYAMTQEAYPSDDSNEQGGNYYRCAAIDEDGDEVTVVWEFYDLEEGEDEGDYPWDDEDYIDHIER